MSEEKQIPERHRKRYESATACSCSDCKAKIPILEELGAAEAQLAAAKQETERYRQQARQLDDEFEECRAQLAAVTKERDQREYLMDLAAKELKRMCDKQDELEAENASLRDALIAGLDVIPFLTGLSDQAAKEREEWRLLAQAALKDRP